MSEAKIINKLVAPMDLKRKKPRVIKKGKKKIKITLYE